MGHARHRYLGPPRMRQRERMEVAHQDTTKPQTYPQQPQWDTGYEGGYSEYQGAVILTTLTVLLGLAKV
jgi:hypothetical protein